MASTALGIAAWGLVTGMTLAHSGMGLPLAVLMSLIVFAGSAQLATAPLIAAGAPLWVVWATAACVNLRFVIFSAGWRPYFAHRTRRERLCLAYVAADLNYIIFMRRFPQPGRDERHWPYFWGGACTNYSAWHAASLAGIVLADVVPATWGIGFAGTLALLGLLASLLGGVSTWLAAAVAGSAAIAAYALPLKLNIVVAIAAAVAIGLVMDQAAAARRGSPSAP